MKGLLKSSILMVRKVHGDLPTKENRYGNDKASPDQ